MPVQIAAAPRYTVFRTIVADDVLSTYLEVSGADLRSYAACHVQIIQNTSMGQPIEVQAYFWSKIAGNFIPAEPELKYTINKKELELTVVCGFRIMFIGVEALPEGRSVQVALSGVRLSPRPKGIWESHG